MASRIRGICLLALAAVLTGSLAAASAPSAADDVAAARDDLSRLQERYGDRNPKVIDQQMRVTELEQLARTAPGEPATLRSARVELSVMLARYAFLRRRMHQCRREQLIIEPKKFLNEARN